MFRTAELGSKVSRKECHEREPALRHELLELQTDLREFGEFPAIVLFAGVDGGGKGQSINLLNEWMDPRLLVTRAYGEPSDEERERPEFWRYWRDLPPKGQIGLFLSSWYSRPLLDWVYGDIDDSGFDSRLDRVESFENMLIDDGAVVIKFWMHLSRDAQKRRLKALEKDPLTRFRVTDRDWSHWKLYDRFLMAAERTVTRTSTGKAHWHIVEGVDVNYRNLTIGTILRDTLRTQLDQRRMEREVRSRLQTGDARDAAAAPVDTHAAIEPDASAGPHTVSGVLGTLDMTQALKKKDYQQRLKEHQARLNLLARTALQQKRTTILVFEGPDAAGKGGAIRRITAALDARNYRVIPIATPTDEERAQHYLWRFWRHLPRAGRMTIFDRSWYGRVLVERVEGYARQDQWRHAYTEINDFESRLTEHGILVVKFWIHITAQEQLERFKAREATPHKRWKLTEEDWRNRDKAHAYQHAVNDMVQHTSTSQAPWTLVEGNDKRFARIKVIKTLCERMGAALDDA